MKKTRDAIKWKDENKTVMDRNVKQRRSVRRKPRKKWLLYKRQFEMERRKAEDCLNISNFMTYHLMTNIKHFIFCRAVNNVCPVCSIHNAVGLELGYEKKIAYISKSIFSRNENDRSKLLQEVMQHARV
jgi:hypothetical protein